MKPILTVDGQVLRGKRVTRYQGQDIAITILVKDDNGSAINIDNLAELHVYMVYGGAKVKAFSKAGTGDADALVKVDTTHYRMDWLSEDTYNRAAGEYLMEINVVETNAAYTDSEKNTVLLVPVVDMVAAAIKSESS